MTPNDFFGFTSMWMIFGILFLTVYPTHLAESKVHMIILLIASGPAVWAIALFEFVTRSTKEDQ